MVRAGAMRFQVVLMQRATTQDAAGETLNTWSAFATRRAAIQRTPGTELFAAAGRNGRVPTVFRLRWLEGVTPGMRVEYDSRLFNIISAVDQEEIGEELVITAEELVGET